MRGCRWLSTVRLICSKYKLHATPVGPVSTNVLQPDVIGTSQLHNPGSKREIVLLSRYGILTYQPDVNEVVMIPVLSSIFVKFALYHQARIYHYYVHAHPKLSTKRLTLAPPFMIEAGPATPVRKAERIERVIESDPQTVSVISSVFDAGRSE